MKQPKTDLEKTKRIIAQNLVAYRKQEGLTQQEIAEILNYSDKAVSKWERGEGLPDVLVLQTLADIYGITVNDFLTERPQNKGRRTHLNLVARHWLITLLSFGLAWLVATVVTVLWLFVDASVPVAKYAYLVAGPVSLTVLLVFSCIWGKLWMKCGSASLLIWSLCVLINVAVPTMNSWLIYIVGIALQLLVVLWFLLQFFVLRDKKKKAELAEETKPQ